VLAAHFLFNWLVALDTTVCRRNPLQTINTTGEHAGSAISGEGSEMSLSNPTSSNGQTTVEAKDLEASERISRRGVLKRIGKWGLLSTAGAGFLELTGVASASTHAPSARAATYGTITTPYGTYTTIDGTPIVTNSGGSPNVCHCRARLDFGQCLSGHPCPPGYCCYYGNGCGIYGPACLSCCCCPTYCYYGCN